jgi:dipeptidyl aminopeptidase/acylaminoacyl peptidase
MNDARARPVQVEDLAAIKTVADVRLSPDARRAVYTLTEIDLDQDRYRSAIWIVSIQDGDPRPFTRGPQRDFAPRWSPDGRWLTFLSDRDGGSAQLYIIPAEGGEPHKLTVLEHGAGPAVWSPDGQRIAFAADVPKELPPVDKDARARWAQRPRVVTRAQYKADAEGYTFDARSQVFVLSLASGVAIQLTSGDADSITPAWSPDGTRIAFSRSREGIADYFLFDIWVMDGEGRSAHRLTQDVGRAFSPTWSPDGSTIACYGTDNQEPGVGESVTRVWLVPAAGGAPRCLTAGYDRSAVILPRPATTPGPEWSADGSSVTFIAADAGRAHVVRADVATGMVRAVVAGERQVQSASPASAAGRIAFGATDPHTPSDVFVCRWDGSDERRLTRVNEALLSRLALPRVERRVFKSPHGETVEGWLIRPVNGQGWAPLLVDIHGGPHSFHGTLFPLGRLYHYVLAGRGWTVLALNPTGSSSYGKAFAHSIRGRWGEYDLPEQLAAVDALVAEGIADGRRLAVAGYSYGGFMTSWTITHTDRFKAAVVGAPVVNLESFHGTSDIGMWFTPWEMRGDIAGQRETYRRLSPINYVDRVTTPTLIVHGEADDRCPIGQGEELFIGLVAAGRVPTEFLRYPGQSHLFLSTGRPSHRLDVNRRVIAWLEKHTLEAGPA